MRLSLIVPMLLKSTGAQTWRPGLVVTTYGLTNCTLKLVPFHPRHDVGSLMSRVRMMQVPICWRFRGCARNIV